MPVVSRIVSYLVVPARKPDAHLHARRNSPVQLAKEFIQANLRSHDTVRELAERFGLSPQYFGDLFKKETGLTVKEYQTKVRAHRAMELLRDSDLKITDIAREVGMEDLRTFPGSSRSSISSLPANCGNRGGCRIPSAQSLKPRQSVRSAVQGDDGD
jgi:methylphosphotriester-DNA--protein-cysteine methyltransferase